jgi:hypothetical protein
MAAGNGSYQDLSSRKQQTPRHPPRRMRTAEDFFKEWEQEDKDFGLRYVLDYKLNLIPLINRTEPDDLLLKHILSTEDLRPYRLIEHLTLEQVRRAHYLMEKTAH